MQVIQQAKTKSALYHKTGMSQAGFSLASIPTLMSPARSRAVVSQAGVWSTNIKISVSQASMTQAGISPTSAQTGMSPASSKATMPQTGIPSASTQAGTTLESNKAGQAAASFGGKPLWPPFSKSSSNGNHGAAISPMSRFTSMIGTSVPMMAPQKLCSNSGHSPRPAHKEAHNTGNGSASTKQNGNRGEKPSILACKTSSIGEQTIGSLPHVTINFKSMNEYRIIITIKEGTVIKNETNSYSCQPKLQFMNVTQCLCHNIPTYICAKLSAYPCCVFANPKTGNRKIIRVPKDNSGVRYAWDSVFSSIKSWFVMMSNNLSAGGKLAHSVSSSSTTSAHIKSPAGHGKTQAGHGKTQAGHGKTQAGHSKTPVKNSQTQAKNVDAKASQIQSTNISSNTLQPSVYPAKITPCSHDQQGTLKKTTTPTVTLAQSRFTGSLAPVSSGNNYEPASKSVLGKRTSHATSPPKEKKHKHHKHLCCHHKSKRTSPLKSLQAVMQQKTSSPEDLKEKILDLMSSSPFKKTFVPSTSIALQPTNATRSVQSKPSMPIATSVLPLPLPLPSNLPRPQSVVDPDSSVRIKSEVASEAEHELMDVDESQEAVIMSSTFNLEAARASGNLFMFVGRVLVGRMCQGRPDMRKPEKDMLGKVTHTAVNNLDKPYIFVVFDNTQCYPEYLIEYSTK